MKAKRKITVLSSLSLILGSILFVCAGTVAPVLATLLQVNDSSSFLYTDGYGYTYRCYFFHDNEGDPVPGVAIAWAETPTNTPSELILPNTVSYNTIDYTVRAIAKHGFRYCDFTSIKIPKTVELIEEEAFAYCQNLESFSFPYLVDKISPSTFLDCRNLSNITYRDSEDKIAFSNDKIKSIGDHAFDSCVSLREFYSPKSLVYYGESCFKNCRSLVNYYFPSSIKEDGVIKNHITVRPYAFADCKSLVYIYFETNVTEIDNYAFVDTNENLHIKYTGTEIPSYSKEGVSQDHWRDFRIATDLTALIPVDVEHPVIYPADDYPCLRYTTESSVVPLDSAQGRTPTVDVIDAAEISSEGEYAVIYKFDTPSVDVPGCFIVSSGTLTIPETIDGKKVKVIKSSAFANNPYIKTINFSKNLVQICNRAFVNCMNISTLNFTLCEKLKEVSYYAFYEYDYDNQQLHNELLTSLRLPDCLEYIGGFAFSMFYNVNDFVLPNNVKAIDDLAFFRLGYSIGDNKGNVELKLPKSLNDADAKKANFKHIAKEYDTNKYYYHNNTSRCYAVGKYAFQEANCLYSVYMEDDPAHANDNTYTTSFYSNVFHTAKNLLRFKASKNLQYLGKDCFKKCARLREVFLTTAKSQASGSNNPWCIDEENGNYGGTLFFESLPELVCFVDGATAPGTLDTYSLSKESGTAQLNSMWNSETTNVYTNESKQGSNLGRKIVPTYYNIDFDSIKYWNPKTNKFVDAPDSYNAYSNGVISFAMNSQTGKYTVARYYINTTSGTAKDLIDLTIVKDTEKGIDVSSNLVEIGAECFAINGNYTGVNDNRNRTPGTYFILPDTITKIGDRAFYRQSGYKDSDVDDSKSAARFGARIITYKDSGGNYYNEEGQAVAFSAIESAINAINGVQDLDKRGFCVLPGNVTSIGKLAFYNHIFRTIRITSTLSYFGAGAFYVHTLRNVSKGVTENIYMDASTNFECVDNGIYFVGNTNKKMLISQAVGEEGTLNIAEGTKAIGLMGCANTKYSKIVLPTGLTTIYGMAFTNNKQLTELSGVSSLRYIGTMKNYLNTTTTFVDDEYTEVWDSTVEPYFENYDYRDYAYAARPTIEALASAFYGCNKLATLDFTAMTELRKIGYQAFYNCSGLKYMAGNKNYVYKKYNASDGSLTVITGRDADNANVLDLSGCTHLRSIDRNAFLGCSNIKYLHLPDNRPAEANESPLYFGKDFELNSSSAQILSDGNDTKYISILVKEKAIYAAPSFGTAHKASNHYPANVFGKKNRVFYFIEQKSDIPESTSGTDLRYWTLGNDGSYILIDSAKDAHKYFPA